MAFDKLAARWQRHREERYAQAVTRRRVLIEKGRSLFRRYGTRKVVLFGSVVSGRSDRRSDIDLFVMPLEQAHYWEFKHEVQEATGYDIDLYTQADDPVFVQKVESRGEVIYHDIQR